MKCPNKPVAKEDEKPGRTIIPLKMLVTPKPSICQPGSKTFPASADDKYGQ